MGLINITIPGIYNNNLNTLKEYIHLIIKQQNCCESFALERYFQNNGDVVNVIAELDMENKHNLSSFSHYSKEERVALIRNITNCCQDIIEEKYDNLNGSMWDIINILDNYIDKFGVCKCLYCNGTEFGYKSTNKTYNDILVIDI